MRPTCAPQPSCTRAATRRLIGYQPRPASAARPPSPLRSGRRPVCRPIRGHALTIPVGTRAQSIPEPGQGAAILRRPPNDILAGRLERTAGTDRRAIAAQIEENPICRHATQLNPATRSFVGANGCKVRPPATAGMCALVSAVQPDTINLRTLVTWSEGHRSAPGREPAQAQPRILRIAPARGAVRRQRHQPADAGRGGRSYALGGPPV